MNRLHQSWIWLRRVRHCRGFGIQSPSDYRFVRYVISERWPYYAYDEVGQGDSRMRRKLGRLFFRLANELQPTVICDMLGYGDYLLAACPHAAILHELPAENPTQLLVSPDHLPLPAALCPAMLVVDDVGHHRQQWQTIVSDPRFTVTFDLYYCGIAMALPKRPRQNYIVNF